MINQNIDLIKPDFILIEGTLINANQICHITHTRVTGKQCQIRTTAESDIDSLPLLFTVSVTDMWNALVELRKPSNELR